MTDDLPLDLHQVAADDEAIEGLRGRSVTPDPALVLLRELLADVDADLPSTAPVGRGSTVLSLAGEQAPERRLARNGTAVALFTAGIVSFGGVAAASVLVPPGNPLHGLGETVRSVAAAVAPPKVAPEPDAGDPAGRAAGSGVVPPRPGTPTALDDVPAAARPSMPGADVSSSARSQAAARQAAARQVAAARASDASKSRPAPKDRTAPKDTADGGKSSSRQSPTEPPVVVSPEKVTRPAPTAPRAEGRVLSPGKPPAQLSRTASMKPRA